MAAKRRKHIRMSTTSVPTGVDLLQTAGLNKGPGFPLEERELFRLRGLLPPQLCTIEKQVLRVMNNFRRMLTDLDRYLYLIALQDRNETLFYRVVLEYLEEMLPIIYTPTVGEACQKYGHIFRRPRGLFITLADRGEIADLLRNWPYVDVRIIVVTDGERILGLGDLGSNGMGIPVGKLSLYTACAGVAPSQCLPITLDVGTNTQSLLDDPLYIGTRERRLRGEDFDSFIAEFFRAVREVFPHAVIQFEDFGTNNAFRLLDYYRDKVSAFNDDIQGTASVVLSGIYSSLRLTGGALKDQRFLFLGAGEAGIGIADLITSAMIAEGLPEAEARKRSWHVDSKGLVVKSRTDLAPHKLPYAHEHEPMPDLLAAVKALKPTGIIGVSGQPGKFTQEIVEAMAELNERPLVFSLSNPTSKSECTAEEAYTWTKGRAIFASGSPFDPVTLDGVTHVPGQGNNAYVFPGVGLGIIACESSRVTDEMFFEAAKTLAGLVTEEDLALGRVYPAMTRIREVSAAIATTVAEIAYERGFARRPKPENMRECIESQMYYPEYEDYI